MASAHASQLRAAPAPAPAPAASPAGSPGAPAGPAVDPKEVVEEAHHQHAGATADRVLDESKVKLKEADVAHAEAGVHVAHALGDKDLKTDYQEKVKSHKEDLTKLAKEATESKAAYKTSKGAYQNAEKAAEKAEKAEQKAGK